MSEMTGIHDGCLEETAKLRKEIKRLRAALREISEMRYRAASMMRARAEEALGDE